MSCTLEPKSLATTLALLLVTPLAWGKEDLASKTEAPEMVPAEDALATVLGEPVMRDDLVAAETEARRRALSPEKFARWQENSKQKLLTQRICGALRWAYADREDLLPTDAEREAFLKHRQAPVAGRVSAERDETPAERSQREAAERAWWDHWIVEYKTGKSLYEKHGGTLGLGSLGSCTPFEGLVAMLKEDVAEKRLVFHDVPTEKLFWHAVVNKQLGADSVLEDSNRIERLFEELMGHLGH